jgi:uncharacterized protein involved in exopolysaccharide biosynthesis
LPSRDLRPRDPDAETLDIGAYLRVLWDNRGVLALCTIVGAAVALAIGVMGARTYEAESALSISRPKIGEGLPAADLMSTANYRPLIESRAIADQVIKDTGLDKPPYLVSPSRFFGNIVDVEEVRASSVIMLRGRLDNPALIAKVVNRVAELGVASARRVSQQEALQARDDIKLQFDEAKSRFDTATANLQATRSASQLELVKKDVEAALVQRGALLELLIATETEKARLAKAEEELAKRNRIETVTRSLDSDPSLLEAARASDTKPKDLLAMQIHNQELSKTYADLDKDVAISRTKLAGLERQRKEMDARKLSSPRLAMLDDMYTKDSEIVRLEMERDLAKSVYTNVATSYETARVQVAGRSSGLQVISAAIPPDAPESRKLLRNLVMGAISGLLLAALAVLMFHAFKALPQGSRV